MLTDLEVPFTTGKACKHGIVGFSQQGQEHLGLCDVCFSNESTEVPNARLCSHECAAKRNECTHFLVYSGTEVVLNRPGYLCSTTYTVA